jgi:hypothetical protein
MPSRYDGRRREGDALMMIRIAVLTCLLMLPAWAQLEGVIDLHAHCAPDSMPRSIDGFELATIAKRQHMRGLLLKNHYTQTASLAYMVHQAVPGIEIYGGIALNASVGGINPAAVEHMVRTTGHLGRVVWMPTFDSEHYHRTWVQNPNHVPISRNGELLPKVIEVLELMAREKLALATGHSSPEESMLLIREAKKRGIDRIIVTHPANRRVSMSIEQQKEAAKLGALLEYPYNILLPTGEGVGIEPVAKAIRAVGPQYCVLSSDLGQVGNAVHTDGLLMFVQQLRDRGFTVHETDQMTKQNPAKFLGLD